MNVIYLFGKTKDETFPQTHKVSATTGQGSTWICQARSFQSLVPQPTKGKETSQPVVFFPLWISGTYKKPRDIFTRFPLVGRRPQIAFNQFYPPIWNMITFFHFISLQKKSIQYWYISWAICSSVKTHSMFYLEALERRRCEACKQCHRPKYPVKGWPLGRSQHCQIIQVHI